MMYVKNLIRARVWLRGINRVGIDGRALLSFQDSVCCIRQDELFPSLSWLNVVEGFFAKLTSRRLKRSVFCDSPERLINEVKGCADGVGIFPNEEATACLVGAILLEQNVQRARNRTLKTVAPLSEDSIVLLPAVAA
jgi:hypothetical protein